MRSSRAVLIARQLPFFIYARYARVPPGNARWRCPHVLSPPNSLVEKGTERHVGGHCEGAHLFPSRTEQLSPSAPMVLAPAGRVGRRQPFFFSDCKTEKAQCHKISYDTGPYSFVPFPFPKHTFHLKVVSSSFSSCRNSLPL